MIELNDLTDEEKEKLKELYKNISLHLPNGTTDDGLPINFKKNRFLVVITENPTNEFIRLNLFFAKRICPRKIFKIQANGQTFEENAANKVPSWDIKRNEVRLNDISDKDIILEIAKQLKDAGYSFQAKKLRFS